MSNLDGLSNLFLYRAHVSRLKRMHTFARVLEKASSRYAPSRLLSFGPVHVFVALQLMHERGHVSRSVLERELGLGGAAKTIVKHMKMNGLVETSNGGTKMTARGRGVCTGLLESMAAEMPVPRSSVALGMHNYAVLLRQLGFAIRSGIEQRDAAIKMGGTGATTLIYRDGRFVMPETSNRGVREPLEGERELERELLGKLKPAEGDAVVIGGADSARAAELATKAAALATIMAHEKH